MISKVPKERDVGADEDDADSDAFHPIDVRALTS